MAAIFVTIATVKVKLIPDFNTWIIAIITNKKNLVKSYYHFLTPYGGKNSLLLHVFIFLFSYIVKDRKFDVTYIINGLLGSLVAITGMVILYTVWLYNKWTTWISSGNNKYGYSLYSVM